AKCNVDYFPQEEVFKYSETESHAQIQTRTETFSADKVLFTTNADLSLMFPEFSAVVQPGRGQILTTEPIPFKVRGPCYFTKDLCYFRQLADGRLLVGGFRNLSPQTEATGLDSTTETIQDALKTFIKTRFVQSPKLQISHQWAGTMAFTTDGQPLLGPHPRYKRLLIHAGCSGHGMGNNFFMAKTLVDYIQGHKIPDVLSLERFYNII
ncbi:MAG: FAD-binding oxidoreductase, partial [Bdellovibrionaceae bacterium]|nr:FAD-binding oxidoreductase [Pseudobdellovibrionaceae bacterium]